jgi:hypothetical protein
MSILTSGNRPWKIASLLCLALAPAGWCAEPPERWVPARWEGGPLEAVRRADDKAVAGDAALRDALLKWYDPSTLALLEGTPVNCLLVTFSTGKAAEVETQQRTLVKEYARAARQRGIAVLGIVHPGSDAAAVAAAATDAALDGLVLDGDFPASAGFPAKLEAALRAASSKALVIPILHDAWSMRNSTAPLVAVEGVRPSARDTSDMGIAAGVSAEPWLESNIWLVRSLRQGTSSRQVWVDQQPKSPSLWDYLTAASDAAAAGGRWIVAVDDSLRKGLLSKNADSLSTWRSLGAHLKLAEDHPGWRAFAPFGKLGIILDKANESPDFSNEYLNLVTRRQIPSRIIERSELTAAKLGEFVAVLVADLAPPKEAERRLLQEYAEKGGIVVAGKWWGGSTDPENFTEVPVGKGMAVVYGDDAPDPESSARDLRDMLEGEKAGFMAFNVPSLITSVSTSDGGKRMLVNLVNYASRPFDNLVTVRVEGIFKTARLYTAEGAPQNLEARPARIKGQTEIGIPKLNVWGVLELE